MPLLPLQSAALLRSDKSVASANPHGSLGIGKVACSGPWAAAGAGYLVAGGQGRGKNFSPKEDDFGARVAYCRAQKKLITRDKEGWRWEVEQH